MKFDYTLYPGRELYGKAKYTKKESPVISIITPYFNSKKYIEVTANSILSQTFPCFEWLIVDDGSTDKDSLEKLKKIEEMDDRIRVFHKNNEGLAATRDYGANLSCETSKYLVFLDDDDVINRTFLECAYWTLETNKKASWAYVDVVNFEGEEFLWRKMFNSEVEKKENLLTAMAMIRKSDFLEVGGYELREKSVFEDWNFWLKLIAKEKFPVRMSFLGFWYRRKPKNESELVRAKENRKNAMRYVNETASKIKTEVEAIQYPKQDYNWEEIIDNQSQIKMPKLCKSKTIKILMICPWMITGGADKFNLDLVSRIDKEKYEFIILTTLPAKNEWRQKFEEHAIVYDLTTFLDRKYWISFINYIIDKNNIDIILNTNSTFGYASIPYLKTKHPEIPVIDYVHMEEWYNRNGGFSRDSSMASDFIDKTYLCNKNSENILVEHFGRKREEVSTMYIGVDEKKFNPELYKKEEILEKLEIQNEGKYIIGFICRIAEQKRPYLLLEIIKELKKKREDFIVVVAGDGPMLEEIKEKAKSLEISNYILFLGNISKTEDIYTISDLTLNCSIKEGLALTAYESLSMGVPVVSSDVGGQKEFINDKTGVIVPCMQDETEIRDFDYKKEEVMPYVEGIDKILKNLESYKSKCRARILNGFTIDNMITNIEKVFDELKEDPNKDKIELAKNNSIKSAKELITMYFIAFKDEYNWLCKDFNRKNVDVMHLPKMKLKGKDNPMYEHTLEYKIKHPIVVFLRKLGIYEFCKKLVGRGED